MRVKAKHWLKYNGLWHCGGDEFEVVAADINDLAEMVDVVETPIQEMFDDVTVESPRRRGRPRKTEE